MIGTGNTVAVRGRTALVPITCRSTAPCTGVAELQSRAYDGGAGVVYAHTPFTIRSGKTMILAVALRKAGRRLLRRDKRARAYLYLRPSDGLPAGTLYVGGEIELTLLDTQRN